MTRWWNRKLSAWAVRTRPLGHADNTDRTQRSYSSLHQEQPSNICVLNLAAD
jgi:hypothetical protein